MVCMALRDDKGRKLVSCREAAKAYGCTMRYLRKLAKDGRLTTELAGGAYLFDLEEVRKMASRRDGGRLKKRSEGFRPG
jgi:excisionase family DNA binding protein